MIDTDVMVILVDLLVIASIVAALAYGLATGLFRGRQRMPRGANVIIVGLILAVLAHVSDLAFDLWMPHTDEIVVTGGHPITEGALHWLLTRLAFGMVAVGVIVMIIARRRYDAILATRNTLVETLKSNNQTIDRRFRYLMENTSDSVYYYRFEQPVAVSCSLEEHIEASYSATLEMANGAFVRELGAIDVSERLGQRYGDLDGAKDGSAHSSLIENFINNGYRLEGYELNYKTPEGEERALNINMIGVVEQGFVNGFWGVESNILERRAAKAELLRQQELRNAITKISSLLVMAVEDRVDDAIRESMGMIASIAGADRSTLFWFDDAPERNILIAYSWATGGEEVFGEPVSRHLFPNLWPLLRDYQVVRIDSVASMPPEMDAERKYLQRIGLASFIVLPLVVEGEIVGGLTFGRMKDETVWSDQAVSEISVFSDILANFVLQLRSRRELAQALQGLQRATEKLQAENVYLREEVERKHGFDEIIGESRALLHSLNLVAQVADTNTPVLITGETGTGKELIARAIHDHSSRCNRPLVKINCAALPASLIESELFGHEKGAFTHAESKKLGRFDLADGSTLFLDEIGEIPIELQSKLLRVLQEGEFERLGGTGTIRVDVRIVVATNRNMNEAVQNGEFRSDLFYRINTFPIELPALRDRGDDIELLARHFVSLHAERLGREVHEISAEMMRQLRLYHWPGNIRELDGIIQRALISGTGPIVHLAESLLPVENSDEVATIISSTIADLKLVEHDHIVGILDTVNWRISGQHGAAAKLGIPPSTLRSKMKKLGITRPH